MSISPCLGRLKSFLATSTPSRKRYSWIALRSALGISLAECQCLLCAHRMQLHWQLTFWQR